MQALASDLPCRLREMPACLPVPRRSALAATRSKGLRWSFAYRTSTRSRHCELLMQGVRDASGLTCCREGSHFLILRENPDTLEVVEIFHGRMNLDEHLERLAKEGRQSRSGP